MQNYKVNPTRILLILQFYVPVRIIHLGLDFPFLGLYAAIQEESQNERNIEWKHFTHNSFFFFFLLQ